MNEAGRVKAHLFVEPSNTLAYFMDINGPVGHIGVYRYGMEVVHTRTNWQKTTYRVIFGQRWGSASGFSDADQRDEALMRSIVTAQYYLIALRTALPGSTIPLLDFRDEPIEEERFTELLTLIESTGVKGWEAETIN